jgi:hypothetical protein
MMENHDDDDLLLSVACGPSTTISALQAAYCEKRRDRIPHVINFVETVVSDYTEEEFRKRFRMNRTTCNALLKEQIVVDGPQATDRSRSSSSWFSIMSRRTMVFIFSAI